MVEWQTHVLPQISSSQIEASGSTSISQIPVGMGQGADSLDANYLHTSVFCEPRYVKMCVWYMLTVKAQISHF